MWYTVDFIYTIQTSYFLEQDCYSFTGSFNSGIRRIARTMLKKLNGAFHPKNENKFYLNIIELYGTVADFIVPLQEN